MIVVLGADGQLGRCVKEELLVNTGIWSAEGIAWFTRRGCDVTNADDVFRALKNVQATIVINAAAYTKVDLAETEHALAAKVNYEALSGISEACKLLGAHLIHFSTDYVFDGTKDGPYEPADKPNPLSVYGRTKLSGEQVARRILPDHSTILRTSWVFSPYGQNFLLTMLKLMATRDEIAVVNDQIGRPTSALELARQISHVVRAIRTQGSKATSGTFHLTCTGAPVSWYQFAQRIAERATEFGFPIRSAIREIPSSAYPTAAGRPKNSVLDTSTYRTMVGHDIAPWTECLDECLGVASTLLSP